MVLVVGMVLSLLASVTVPISKQRHFDFIPATDLNSREFSASLALE
jgi:hypothetical protein